MRLGLPDPAPWAGFNVSEQISCSERILSDPEPPNEQLHGIGPRAEAALQNLELLPAAEGPTYTEVAATLTQYKGKYCTPCCSVSATQTFCTEHMQPS